MCASRFSPSVILITTCILISSTPITDCPNAPRPCRDNMIMHHGTSHCCKGISCGAGTFVQPCQEEGGHDTCSRCEPGTHMLDNTTSELIVPCINFGCDPEKSVPSNVSATVNDGKACGLHCRCDLSRNYCGTNPCACLEGTCDIDMELLQNCSCIPRKRSEKPLSPPFRTITVIPSTSSKEKGQGLESHESDINEDHLDGHKIPGTDIPSSRNPERPGNVPMIEKVVMGCAVAVISIILAAVGFVIWVICCREPRNRYQGTHMIIGDRNRIYTGDPTVEN